MELPGSRRGWPLFPHNSSSPTPCAISLLDLFFFVFLKLWCLVPARPDDHNTKTLLRWALLCHKSNCRSVLTQKFSLCANRQLHLGVLLLLQDGSWATSKYHFHMAYFILLHSLSLWKHAWSLLISFCATLQLLGCLELLSRELSCKVFPFSPGQWGRHMCGITLSTQCDILNKKLLFLLNWVFLAALAASTYQLHYIAGLFTCFGCSNRE